MAQWKITIDCETDWGGRSQNTLGLKYGLPKILELLKYYRINGLFFISTELLSGYKNELKKIIQEGHEIGSHGHFHVVFKNKARAEEDRRISNLLLTAFTGKDKFEYRAPKFNYRTESVYSNPENHVSLLKYCWFRERVLKNSIFYLHPFDIIEDRLSPPNLFCKLWYSKPHVALEKLIKVFRDYSHENLSH